MLSVHHIISADASLGRVDKSSLPQEALMELLISTIEGRESISGSEANPSDLNKWHGIKMSPTNEVRVIVWSSLGLGGSLEFRWLPESVITFNVYGDRFSGAIDWQPLKETSVQRLTIGGNRFSGTLALEFLPESVVYVDACKNQFDGLLLLSKLPGKIEQLFAYENKFQGTLELTSLPKSMLTLSVATNNFSGPIVFKNLPERLRGIFLSNNALSGDVDLRELPKGIERLNLSKNQFDGSIFLTKIPSFSAVIWVTDNQELKGSLELFMRESEQIKIEGTKIEISIKK